MTGIGSVQSRLFPFTYTSIFCISHHYAPTPLEIPLHTHLNALLYARQSTHVYRTFKSVVFTAGRTLAIAQSKRAVWTGSRI